MTIRLKPLREQVIVVTGATSGNGLATVEEAIRQGAAVVAAARNEAALEAMKARLATSGGRVATCVADVSDASAVNRIVDAATTAFGGFDSWINNAGVGTYGTLEQVPIEDHRRVFDVNYFGALHGSLAAARHLRVRGSGAIVNVGSILGDRSIVQQGPYCATKHAVQALTDTLRMELEREGAGISVTLVKPGAIDTPFPEHARNFMDQPPRLPPPLYAPSVVADAILFACANPRRTLYAGGGGLLSSMLGQMAPRLTDVIMEMTGTTLQQKPNDPGDATRRDNLHHSRNDALRGSQKVHARRSSIALQIQKTPPPLLALAIFGAGASAVHSLWARRHR
ncbi:SDR family oxidoreductase [Sphingomonas melonis]|uniref:NAD(P)-dependent dehydrogenase (Short-subunit alcohol dehydrogenase family) n=1 Tax=Sphingomonas melonis TaxID=152682 RepID=A0A7Y9FKP4_9SPHN|nr:SDR family oxidoreductase [Sphingomonas melonis]NYD89040.1 NAD(P)-dependent dehydrogenase (short-subunit alcohol dehydrogenase family) [Sphingomonas melonis]